MSLLMSRAPLAQESAALTLTNDLYGQMVSLPAAPAVIPPPAPGVPAAPPAIAGLQGELTQGFDALQNQAVPALPLDVAHGLRSMRDRTFDVLGDVIQLSGFTDDRAVDMLRLAESGVRARLVEQARTAVNQRMRESGMGWTRYLGNRLGGAIRNVRGLWNEAGPRGLLMSFGAYGDRRVTEEVAQQIQARFAGRDFNALAAADQDLVRREAGRLAPNTLAFNQKALVQWANTNMRAATNPPTTGVPLTYYQLCSELMGNEPVGSHYAMPILALIQKNRAYQLRMEELYDSRANERPVQKDYRDERTRRTKQEGDKNTLTERVQHIEAALGILSQIREQESARAAYRQKVEETKKRLPTGTPQPPGSKELEASLREYSSKEITATSALSRLVSDLKSKYRPELTYAGSQLTPSVNFPLLLTIVPATATPIPPNAGGLETPDQPNVLINQLQEILDDDAGTLRAPTLLAPAAGTRGLREELDLLKEAIDRRDEPYSPSFQPNLAAAGYKDFVDLQTKNSTASEERTKAARLTPHQLLYELLYRQLRVETPPPAVPSPPDEQNLHMEEAQVRAVIATLMLMDRVDSSMDEGFTVRNARNITRNRALRVINREGDSRLTFEEVVKGTLIKEEGFKGLKDLTLKTTANDIIRLINQEKLKQEDLPELMRQIELLGQDQFEGKGNLKFESDARPLLYQLQLAWYRLKAEPLIAKVNEPNIPNKAETLLNMLREKAPEAIPPEVKPGSEPLKLDTRSEIKRNELIATLRKNLEEIGEESPEGQLLKKRLSYLERFSSQFVADALFTVMARLPGWWRRRKIATAATEALEEIPGAIKKSRRAISGALEDVTELTPAGAHG